MILPPRLMKCHDAIPNIAQYHIILFFGDAEVGNEKNRIYFGHLPQRDNLRNMTILTMIK